MVIVFDSTETVDIESIAAVIEGLDAGAAVVEIKLDVDEQSGAMCVVVTVAGDKDVAESLVVEIDKEKQKGADCSAGVLCHATDVFIPSSDSPSHAHRKTHHLAMLLVPIVFHILTLTPQSALH